MTPEQRAKNEQVEQRIMGETLKAETDDEIDCAVAGWPGLMSAYKPGVRVWRNRVGQGWQQSLEQHVANWRKEPRDFCNDWNLIYEMESKMEGAIVSLYLVGFYSHHSAAIPNQWARRHPPSPEFCVDAALRALDAAQQRDGDSQ